jgi:hypothetical protein
MVGCLISNNVLKLSFRNEDQEERCQGVQILSVVPIVSSQAGPHVLGSNWGLGESSLDEPLRKDCKGDSVLTLHMSEVKECGL